MENNTSIQIKQIPTDISNIRHFYDYENLKVTCKDEYETAATYFLQVKHHLKITEAERTKITGPINQALKNTNDLFKRISDPLNKIKNALESKLRIFADSERKKLEEEERLRREEEKRKFDEQAKAAKLEAMELESETALETAHTLQKRADSIDTENVIVKQTVRAGSIGTMAERRTWKWKVTDEKLIPRSLLVVDEKQLNAMAKAYGQNEQAIPGIEFYQETSFSATTR